jgi:hypothetical protein
MLWDITGGIGAGLRWLGDRTEQFQARMAEKIGGSSSWRSEVAPGLLEETQDCIYAAAMKKL